MANKHQDHCAVCNLNVEDMRYSEKYGNRLYCFCSEQCRKSFTSRPGLYSHYPFVKSTDITKNRNLRFSEPLDELKTHKVNDRLSELVGVKEWQIKGATMHIQYDLQQSNLGQVEAVLRQGGVSLDHRWWHRAKRAWLLNTEETELENLAAPAGACCNRPPPGA